MKKYTLLILLLLPAFAWADSLVYLKANAKVVDVPMQGPTAILDVEGTIDQPISLGVVSGTQVWAALVKDEKAIEKNAAYLGKGLDNVKKKDKAVYDAITAKVVRLEDGTEVRLKQSEATPAKATVIEADLPLQTFSGFDPKTGDAK